MKHPDLPSIDALKAMLSYEPSTGVITWLVRPSRNVFAGSAAGHVGGNGYISITINKHRYKAHRLAWLLAYGAWPSGHIDHINGDKADNSITNLRDVTRRLNQQNQRRAMSTNLLGVLGVSRSRGRFSASIRVDGKQCRIGTYDTPEEASAAYVGAKRVFHEGCTL